MKTGSMKEVIEDIWIDWHLTNGNRPFLTIVLKQNPGGNRCHPGWRTHTDEVGIYCLLENGILADYMRLRPRSDWNQSRDLLLVNGKTLKGLTGYAWQSRASIMNEVFGTEYIDVNVLLHPSVATGCSRFKAIDSTFLSVAMDYWFEGEHNIHRVKRSVIPGDIFEDKSRSTEFVWRITSPKPACQKCGQNARIKEVKYRYGGLSIEFASLVGNDVEKDFICSKCGGIYYRGRGT